MIFILMDLISSIVELLELYQEFDTSIKKAEKGESSRFV